MNATKNKLCLALDVDTADQALSLVRGLKPYFGWFKVGLQLYVAEGPALVEALKKEGVKVFLDLKLHDIPNTVAKAVTRVVALGADMTTLHVAGCPDMLKAAADAAADAEAKYGSGTVLVGVTLLTSIDETEMLLHLKVAPGYRTSSYVSHLANTAKRCLLGGVVCSARELPTVGKYRDPAFMLVTPGIRPFGADNDDQARVSTPRQALDKGSDLLVVGRTVLGAKDREAVAQALLEEARA